MRNAAFAAVVLVAIGCSSEPNYDKHKGLVHQYLDDREKFIQILQNVKDKKSAKAAVPELEELAKKLEGIGREIKGLPKLTEQEKVDLAKEYGTDEYQKRARPLINIAQVAGVDVHSFRKLLVRVDRAMVAIERK